MALLVLKLSRIRLMRKLGFNFIISNMIKLTLSNQLSTHKRITFTELCKWTKTVSKASSMIHLSSRDNHCHGSRWWLAQVLQLIVGIGMYQLILLIIKVLIRMQELNNMICLKPLTILLKQLMKISIHTNGNLTMSHQDGWKNFFHHLVTSNQPFHWNQISQSFIYQNINLV